MPFGDPFALFGKWYRAARRGSGRRIPESMCLSTVGPNGFPEGRIVLLKGFDRSGFVFYTNLLSRKGRSLAARPRAALTFYWENPGRQVRVEGRTVAVTAAEADAYFASRPRESRIGAWASAQSRLLPSRAVLERRFAAFSRRFRGGPVPRPPHWSGVKVVPDRIEFWRGRAKRLHDRILFTRRAQGPWTARRLYP